MATVIVRDVLSLMLLRLYSSLPTLTMAALTVTMPDALSLIPLYLLWLYYTYYGCTYYGCTHRDRARCALTHAVGEGRAEDGRAHAEDHGVGCEAHRRLVTVGGLEGKVSG